MDLLVMTWENVYSATLELSKRIEESSFVPDSIVGVARGGWVVARILSDLLGVEELVSLKISFYRGINQRDSKPRIVQPIVNSMEGKRVLIVDDVADTGESLSLAIRHCSELGAAEVRVATLHVKPWSKVNPDYYVCVTSSWILYPWEYRETMVAMLREWSKEGVPPEEQRSRLAAIGIPPAVIDRYMPRIKEGC